VYPKSEKEKIVLTVRKIAMKRIQRKINVILITPDQMRADHLHCYGYFRKTSPNIDAMADEGTLFKRHYTVASWTTPSFASIFSSLVPSQHRMTMFMYGLGITMDSSISLLAEQFKMVGYKTVAFIGNPLAGEWLLGRGFEEYYGASDSNECAISFEAERVNETVFKWLDQHYKESFFMWVYYTEPHSPYNPPVEHDIFKTSAYPDEINDGYTPERNKGYLFRLAMAGDRMAVERLKSLYDGKIHYIDYHIGQLIRKLKELDLDESTLIVFLSDHGELLYEHVDCLTFDHRSLYDSNIHVPLIISGPSIPKGQIIDAVVCTLDVAPTITDVAGVPPIDNAQGKSLLPLINGQRDAIHKFIFAEQDVTERLRSVCNERYKLIYHLQDNRKQLFDRLSDPLERNDIADQAPDVVRNLKAQLIEYMRKNEPPEKEKLTLWRRVGYFKPVQIVDEVTTGAQFQFFGMDYETIPKWVRMADGGGNYMDACYWIKPGDGDIGAIWRTNNPMLGVYNIYLWYGVLPHRRSATNAHFTVVTCEDAYDFIIDQNKNVNRWNLLGEFKDPLYVQVTNKADGPVILDAVKFERIEDRQHLKDWLPARKKARETNQMIERLRKLGYV